MSEITTIPLNKLVPWDGNVRKTGAADGIAELASSIAAHGLLQAIVVRKATRGKYSVVAGRRRYLALMQLAEAGTLENDHAVSCHVLDAEADPTEISLVENVVRLPMHPADQFEAYRQLIDHGATAGDVAARFGVSENIVVQRMKLGRVSPALLDLYRAGEMSLDQVKAFTVTDDHAAQEQTWSTLPAYGRHGSSIRQALTAGEIPATDKRVRLVTLEAYEAAGGAVRRDLFDERNAGYIVDTVLLDRLVQTALGEAAATVTAEGWKWVDIHPDFDWQARSAFQQIYPQAVALSAEEEAEMETLTAEAEALYEQADAEPLTGADEARLATITARLEYLTDRLEAFSEADLASAGAIVSLRHDGSVAIERGFLRAEDVSAPDRGDETGSAGSSKAGVPGLPASLVEELTRQRTTALQAELATAPDVALAAVVHALTLRAFYPYGVASCLQLRVEAPRLGAAGESSAALALQAERERWGDHLPGQADDLWSWCLDQGRDRLLDLLAIVAAPSIDAISPRGGGAADRLRHADQLAAALSLDMTRWYAPTAETFFSRIPKSLTLEAIAEARQAPNATAWAKLKKADLAALAERSTASTGWLPEPLRTIANDDADFAPWEDAAA